MSRHRRNETAAGGLDLPSFARCDPSSHTEIPLIFWRRYCPLHQPVEYAKFSAEHRGFAVDGPVVP